MHGGSSGVRDIALLQSAIARPFATFGGRDLYSDIYSKLAALMHSIVKNHPFVDGNKRTALVSVIAVLKLNNYDLKVDQKEIVKFMIYIANKDLTLDEISTWLKKHSVKI